MAGGTTLQVAEIVRGRVSRDDLNVGARAACAVPGQLVERMRPQPVGVRGQADMSATRTLGSSRFAAGRHTNCQKGNEQSPAYAIGADTDLAYLSPAVITSAVKRVDRAVALTIQRLRSGQFQAGKQVLSFQDDATGFSTPSSIVPQDLIDQVLDIRSKIRTGAITPPDTVPPGT
ncbi:MAG: BMP family ABC transporter substrate-binding protein [Chloroflexi bacterium]|nr:MAG: BMP family ABC transporter substrate-binding protein [Chloroflexota bacterium]